MVDTLGQIIGGITFLVFLVGGGCVVGLIVGLTASRLTLKYLYRGEALTKRQAKTGGWYIGIISAILPAAVLVPNIFFGTPTADEVPDAFFRIMLFLVLVASCPTIGIVTGRTYTNNT